MPQLVMVALLGTLGVVAARTFAKAREHAAIRLREAERAMADRPMATLVQDPVTGVYRPIRRD
ncbi:hypothetical protein GGR25_001644 [Kaistia hirudinis]|uniref:Uncharacterized protein n=1 Tax=Kaistia hirudinis TaxID=1293440 RepID=A0A840AQ40_9HYPH|nr:hypothetical protein [Kaistia hirudinis]MBB3930605.1 hypothetical protein [Kaistia hirudinis]MBN9017417.1 hypothetical protein [Hyphomicrobiales bacterium]HWJ71947.1 hypothetical protein [Kaistia sp.]